MLIDSLAAYVRSRQLEKSSRQRIQSSVRRWVRFGGSPDRDGWTPDYMQSVQDAMAARFALETAYRTTKDVIGIIKQAGHPVKPLRLLRVPQPIPDVPTLDEFSRIWRACCVARLPAVDPCGQWRRFLAVLYFTGLRCSDARSLTWEQVGGEAITIRAAKTGKIQTIPIHPVLRKVLASGGVGHIFSIGPRQFYAEFIRIRRHARLNITAQHIRRLAAQQFEQAHGGAGALILGHSLPRETAYYLWPPMILREACARLAVPDCLVDPGTIREKSVSLAALRRVALRLSVAKIGELTRIAGAIG